MYKRCITEQSALRQRQLTAGLLEMMSKEHYDDITVSSFCEQMNIPRKSFYRYFSSKEGALYALLDNAVLDFQGEIFTDDAKATQETLERFFAYWKNQRKLLTALEQNGLFGTLFQRAVSKTISDDLISHKLEAFFHNYPSEYIIMFLSTGLLSMVMQWHQNGYKDSVSRLAAMATHLLSTPMIKFHT